MGIKLVIVESPAKARKIGGFLGDDYVVEASVGHIRDLPQRAADIPKEFKKIAWAKEGVNIEEGFEPLYVINPDKRAKVSELKALMKDHNMKAVNIAELLDVGEGLVSEMLNYKKGLSKETIRILSNRFKLNQEAFNRPYELQKKKVYSVTSLR